MCMLNCYLTLPLLPLANVIVLGMCDYMYECTVIIVYIVDPSATSDGGADGDGGMASSSSGSVKVLLQFKRFVYDPNKKMLQ